MASKVEIAVAGDAGRVGGKSFLSVPHKSSMEYRPAIDGLRGVAVLAVLIFHLKRAWLRGGFVGVDVFFVISGYLITSILLREYERNVFSIAKFYQRRIARLFPAFFTVALVTLWGASFIYSPQDMASSGANLVAATLSVANFKFLLQGNYFVLSPDAQPYLHYWSLSVEEQFYLLFPALLLLLYLKANRYRITLLSVLCMVSLLACIAITLKRPAWAFYMLPTRAWELLAGSILANICVDRPPGRANLWGWLSLTGLALIGISLFTIHDGAEFPGYLAIFPVAGTVAFIGPNKVASGLAERLLSWRPMVLVGRMSYSLYLWHWPVFSMVDYKLNMASAMVRIGLKIGLTLAATVLCFQFVETPGRVYLNQPNKRWIAFGLLASAVLIFIPLGIYVRNTNYINAEASDVAHGGLIFNASSARGCIVLMGDSNGSMYGKMTREIADQLGMKLMVISAAAADPLPHTSGRNPPIWDDSLAVVKRERPHFLVLACHWESKLKDDPGRLAVAVSQLKQYTDRLILITQPPELPPRANRESIRNGARPPFMEDPTERESRMQANAIVKSFVDDRVIVVDIESHFVAADRSILFADLNGDQFYHDSGHLSGYGADLVKVDILRVIAGARPF
jgi:peptidoglycan/LPS O-acetylase OafA/YrhL